MPGLLLPAYSTRNLILYALPKYVLNNSLLIVNNHESGAPIRCRPPITKNAKPIRHSLMARTLKIRSIAQRHLMLTSCCSGKPVPAKIPWHNACIACRAVEATLLLSIAPPSRKASPKANCSALTVVLIPGLCSHAQGLSKRLTWVRCIWMKSTACRFRFKPSYCECSNHAALNGSAQHASSRSTCASSRPLNNRCMTWLSKAASGGTCIFA
ncbi:hypothetical protein [Pseudomonas sp. 22 E 5]|nr:hypothetical protein [Pseudomonas sp. 22 E 5]